MAGKSNDRTVLKYSNSLGLESILGAALLRLHLHFVFEPDSV